MKIIEIPIFLGGIPLSTDTSGADFLRPGSPPASPVASPPGSPNSRASKAREGTCVILPLAQFPNVYPGCNPVKWGPLVIRAIFMIHIYMQYIYIHIYIHVTYYIYVHYEWWLIIYTYLYMHVKYSVSHCHRHCSLIVSNLCASLIPWDIATDIDLTGPPGHFKHSSLNLWELVMFGMSIF